VQVFPLVKQTPSPGFASTPSPMTFTVNVFAAAKAFGSIAWRIARGRITQAVNIDSMKTTMKFRVRLVRAFITTSLCFLKIRVFF
jgi:hypothetical protein